MKNNFFVLCFLCAVTCLGDEPKKNPSSSIAGQLSSLNEGSRVVYELPQSIVSIYVSKKSADSLILDVASATKDILGRENIPSWLEWSRKNTPSATLQEKITIELPEGKVLHPSSNYAWLITLLSLETSKMPLSSRKKAGPTPMPGEHDNRPVWHPKVIVQGTKIATESSMYRIIWPDDGSSLAKREIFLYFPLSQLTVNVFPYWIESPSSSYKIFVVDSEKASL